MPYRRLPNTDSARLRAMQKALNKSEGVLPFNLPISAALLQEMKYFMPEFKQAVILQREIIERQADRNKQHQESYRKARIYISHFIQVLNFGIIRGELKPDTRKFFDLDEDEAKLPQLNTERDIIDWGKKLIDGEQKRLAQGLTPVTNPTIARVKIHYEDFVRLNISHKGLLESNNRATSKISELREKADRIILNSWNEIEEHFSDCEPALKREKSSEYGVVYVFRKHEKLDFTHLKLQI